MRKKFVLIGAILFVLVALAVTTFLVKQNQDNRQRASGDTLSTIVTSGTRDSFKSWASTKTIAQINDEVAALSQADRDALANLVIETNLTGTDKDKLMVAVMKVLNNKTTGFYAEIWSYTHLFILAGTGGGHATCNTAELTIKDADAATFLDTLFHESLHSFNCVNSGPDGALNEGSAIWIFKVAFPDGRNPDELTSGFAETVYGTVNYYRDYGVDGNHSIPLTALGNTTPKSKELFTWLSSVDGSHLPYADQTKLQYCYDTYYKNIPRTDPDWFAKAKSASQSMVADPKCFTPTQNTTPTTTTTPSPTGVMLDQEEWNFVKIINDYRATFNLQPLKVSKTLYKAAKWMTEDMKNQQKLSHIDSLGRNPWQRATFFGYPGQASENAAVISGGLAQSVFAAWRDGCDADSTGKCTYAHREGMKGATDRAIGIARFPDPNGHNWWWTADFGPTLDAEITQTPTPSITNTPTPTATQVPTGTTPTSTVTPTIVTLPTNTPTNTPTPTPTRTPTPTPTNTPTPTPSPTPTTPITPTPTVVVITQAPSPTPTNTPTPAQGQASLTPTLSPTPTVILATATNTPSPTTPPTATPTIAKPGGVLQTFGVIGGIFIVIVAGIFLLAL